MRVDNFYFVVEDIKTSVEFYTKLLEKEPTTVTGSRWADWENENNQIYFGILSRESAECEIIKGNNGVLGLYTEDIDKAFEKCKEIGAKILYKPYEIPYSPDHYKCFAIEDMDGNTIEIASYDRNVKIK